MEDADLAAHAISVRKMCTAGNAAGAAVRVLTIRMRSAAEAKRGKGSLGKIVFLDIDGTIWNIRNEIPESTAEAVRRLRENGNFVFINTGRTRGFIRDPKLFGIGFNGIVSGCGTMIEYMKDGIVQEEENDDSVIYYHAIDPELAEYTVSTVRKYGFRPILEGRRYLYMDDEEFTGEPYGDKLRRELGRNMMSISGNWKQWEISKLSCATDHAEREKCFGTLSEYYTYMIHNSSVCEMVPNGFGKEKGILRLCELLGVDAGDTYAFGDSANDIDMLRTAGTGVAMGNGSDEVKKVSDYVTAPMEEDGIFKACRRLGLI